VNFRGKSNKRRADEGSGGERGPTKIAIPGLEVNGLNCEPPAGTG